MKIHGKIQIVAVAFVFGFLSSLASSVAEAEDWKNPVGAPDVMVGGLVGVGVLYNLDGFALMGTVSKKILKAGFFPDVTNSAALEAQLGPLFTHGSAAFAYSFHLRWDFEKDSTWTFYGLGGLGGGVISGDSLGKRFELYPRFGIGAFWKLNPRVFGRAEISHELLAVGFAFPF